MARASETFRPAIPSGCQIYAARLFVQGLHIDAHRSQGERFARGRAQEITLLAEPSNPHDKNAVRVIGTFKGLLLASRAELGYVPKDIAEALVTTALLPSVSPRLKYVSVGDDGRVDIEFDIVGPKEQKKVFDAFFEKKLNDGPATGEQKEFAWFFNIKLPKGATFGQAKSELDLRMSSLQQETPAALLEWEAYWRICEELDDADNRRDLYSVKSISRKILRTTIDTLKKEGKTIPELADDPQVIVDRVITDHPSLERED
jgi:HIRAN domain